MNETKHGPSPILGFLDGLDEDCAVGWAWSPKSPYKKIEVAILEGDFIVGRGLADKFRADLLTAKIGDGSHSFRIPVAQEILDGNEHRLALLEADSRQPVYVPQVLDGRVAVVASASVRVEGRRNSVDRDTAVGALIDSAQGALDSIHGNIIHGWARYPKQPTRRVDIEVLATDGRVIARGRAAEFRADLVVAKVGDGFHGFAIPLPVEEILRGRVWVSARVVGERAPLPGGPLRADGQGEDHEAQRLLAQASELAGGGEGDFIASHMYGALFGARPGPSALDPDREFDFTNAEPGEGWEAPLRGGGFRIGASGSAVLRVSRLPRSPSSIRLLLAGPQSELELLQVWLDQVRLSCTLSLIPGSINALITAPLPQTGRVRTPASLRFVTSTRGAGGGSCVLFHHLRFRP